MDKTALPHAMVNNLLIEHVEKGSLYFLILRLEVDGYYGYVEEETLKCKLGDSWVEVDWIDIVSNLSDYQGYYLYRSTSSDEIFLRHEEAFKGFE